ncbi:MAG: LysR family transcriptional regulator [Anaerolineae bacterium]
MRTFEAVARYGNITRAAQDLGLTQPAVSGQIQALEHEFGLRLVERLPRGVVLTQAGESLLGYARRLLGLEGEAAAVMGELRGQQAGLLRLSASPTIGSYVLPALLRQFKLGHPEARLVVQVQSTPRVVEALLARESDAGLVEAETAERDLIAEPFLDDELILVVPADHPWAKRGSIASGELADADLVTREPGSGTRAMLEGALGALGLRPRAAAELGTVEAIKSAVAAGLGVSFVSRLAVNLELRHRVLAEVTVEGLTLRRRFYYLRHKYRYPTALLGAFAAIVQGYHGTDCD